MPKTKYFLALALCTVLFAYGFTHRNTLTPSGPRPTPTPAIQVVMEKSYSAAEVQAALQAMSTKSLPIQDIKVNLTRSGRIQLSGKFDPADLDTALWEFKTISPLGYKLIKSLPVSSKFYIESSVAIVANILTIKTSSLKIAGISVSSNVLDIDAIITREFTKYTRAHPEIVIDSLEIDSDSVDIIATLPEGFKL